MIKRTTTETTYEYDKDGNLVKKIVVETHEEDVSFTPTCPNPLTYPYTNWWDTGGYGPATASTPQSATPTTTTITN